MAQLAVVRLIALGMDKTMEFRYIHGHHFVCYQMRSGLSRFNQ